MKKFIIYKYIVLISNKKGMIYMKITLPESAVKTLKDILQENQDRP